MNEAWKTINIMYDKKNNTITFPVKSDKILPAFLHYLLEYHKLPQNAKLIFLDQTVRLEKIDQEYIYRRV